MNTKHIKSYAPKARNDFMKAVAKRLQLFGISADKNGELHLSDAQVQGSVLAIDNQQFDAKLAGPRKRLVERAQNIGFNELLEHVAYTWFNRLCAIRYMELHNYFSHGFRVLSHPTHKERIEIIDHAADVATDLGLNKEAIVELKLAGDKDEELYRELLLGQCHQLHQAMPFLFEAIDDETELLLPDNLTRTDSLLKGLVNDVPEEDWQNVEVIGWLYQFYISEKKDNVIGKVVKSEDIPAATQLFTPNWIVQYLVQNSLGRHWLQSYPDSPLKAQMPYYIEPGEQPAEVEQQLSAINPATIEPESIKVLDPACGSGHILVEAYKVLKVIYEERGYRGRDIPQLILKHNLFGLDIDDRAGQLAGFTLMMLAREDDRRFFRRVESGEVTLNVASLQESVHLNADKLWRALNLNQSWKTGSSQGLFEDEQHDLSSDTADNRYTLLKETLARFTEAKTFGSLIEVPNEDETALAELLSDIERLSKDGDAMQRDAAAVLQPYIKQAWILSQRYDAVIANPPYMGSKGMNAELKHFAKDRYPDSKSDLFSMYVERCLEFTSKTGSAAMVTPYVWMFISSYQKFRNKLIGLRTLRSLVQLEYNAFAPACIPVCCYVIDKVNIKMFMGDYIRLTDFKGSEQQAPKTLEAINKSNCSWRYAKSSSAFASIPGSPIAYWLDESIFSIFENNRNFKDVCYAGFGIKTGDNSLFMREWSEVSLSKLSLKQTADSPLRHKWYPCASGGKYRKWFGNQNLIVDYENEGSNIKDYAQKNGNSFGFNGSKYYFKESITWPKLTSSANSFRYTPPGHVFDGVGLSAFFSSSSEYYSSLALLNSNIYEEFINVLAPTLSFTSGDFLKLPYIDIKCEWQVKALIKIHKEDWDASEVSFNFERNALLDAKSSNLANSYESLLNKFKSMHSSAKRLEEELNNLVLEALNVEPDQNLVSVDDEKITLRINDYYEYGKEDERRRRAEVHADFISYAIGCMMGRYSLDKPGLILASQGETIQGYIEQIPSPQFMPDDDAILPLTDEEWFADDVTNRFREFVKVVWGEETLQENLDFVAESLCLHAIKPKKSETAMETIRRYLSTQFFKDHMKTYKKRPIYWLFSSGKQKAFECLVYLHRYNEGTLSRMRTEYVTPLMGKYESQINHIEEQQQSATTAEKNKLAKALKGYQAKLNELREFDNKLKHYADRRIQLDLDDGVKVNYGKFGDLLANVKDITGKKPTD